MVTLRIIVTEDLTRNASFFSSVRQIREAFI
jgi:hypothetical protein